MNSSENKTRNSIVSSCVNIFLFLLVFGIGLITVIGVILTSIDVWFYPGTNSIQNTGTPTAQFPRTLAPSLTVEPDTEIPKAPIHTRIPSTPFPTPTLRPEATQTVTCVYRIKFGDTLYSIAKRFGIESSSAIRCSSSGCTLSNPKKLGVGWLVTIPNVTAYTCLLRGGGYP